jgi:hypothetical protein
MPGNGQVFDGWHREGEPFYHNNVNCEEGRSGQGGRMAGSGGKELCPECEGLNGPPRELPGTFGG